MLQHIVCDFEVTIRYVTGAVERVARYLALMDEVARTAKLDRAELDVLVRNHLMKTRSMDGFIRTFGVVKERVICHLAMDNHMQLNELNQDCWTIVRRYLVTNDIKPDVAQLDMIAITIGITSCCKEKLVRSGQLDLGWFIAPRIHSCCSVTSAARSFVYLVRFESRLAKLVPVGRQATLLPSLDYCACWAWACSVLWSGGIDYQLASTPASISTAYVTRAVDRVSRYPGLLEEVARRAKLDQSELAALVRDQLMAIQSLDGFMSFVGVVNERVMCHSADDSRVQLDDLNEDYWRHVRWYLVGDDVKCDTVELDRA
ncbi:uncharacterized protein LOC142785405 [Rhipicephalus microplus]|uniref:uncharacterized protein LOC142785405 n=1 Tax=Rhipicephalus microplus TaxID=6941 RepID=UPI003F6BE3E5